MYHRVYFSYPHVPQGVPLLPAIPTGVHLSSLLYPPGYTSHRWYLSVYTSQDRWYLSVYTSGCPMVGIPQRVSPWWVYLRWCISGFISQVVYIRIYTSGCW